MGLSKKQVSFVLILAVLVISVGFVSAGHSINNSSNEGFFEEIWSGVTGMFHSPGHFGFGGSGQPAQCLDKDSDGYDGCHGIAFNDDDKDKDCDDNNKNVNPGHKEVCGDSLDNDCDGRTDEGCLNNSNPQNTSCSWVKVNEDSPSSGKGDFETLIDAQKNTSSCKGACDINCTAEVPSNFTSGNLAALQEQRISRDRINDYGKMWGWSVIGANETGESIICSRDVGVICKNSMQADGECDYDYSVGFKFCDGGCKNTSVNGSRNTRNSSLNGSIGGGLNNFSADNSSRHNNYTLNSSGSAPNSSSSRGRNSSTGKNYTRNFSSGGSEGISFESLF
ncbi:MAG: MopE-related protein [Candidatus Pacearchaeota archaeon]